MSEQRTEDIPGQARNGGPPTSPTAETPLAEHVELALRERITVLEEWRERTEPAFALVCASLIALALAGLILAYAVRKGLRR